MSFTPGPWDVVELEIFGRGDVEGSATIVKWDDDREGYQIIFEDVDYSDDESKANARIAMAAPELLKALETLFVELKKYENISHPDGCDGARDFNVKLMHARHAIAKARGEGV